MTVDATLLELLAEKPETTGIFTDFDGTLSAVVADPEDARPLPDALKALGLLAGRLPRVVVVSGRPAAWLAGAFAPVGDQMELYGLHGLEHCSAQGVVPVEEAAAWAPAVTRAVAAARAAGIRGLDVEDKTYTFTLHWRRAADPDEVARQALGLAARLAAADGFELRPGKASLELVPSLDIDKGTVVRDRSCGLEAVAYLGDDTGDVAGFRALDELEVEGVKVVRVAASGAGAPEELLSRADLVLEGPEQVTEWLVRLASLVAAH